MRNTFVRAKGPGLLLLTLVTGCAGGISLPTGAPATGGVPGFDTWQYPGTSAMANWRQASPYRWVGYYLSSPCHRDASWMGKRQELEGMGWGLAVLYVGQQAFEGQPADNPGTEQVLCSRSLLTPEQGRTDARDAIAKTAAEGFGIGTVIFLDIERMEQTAPAITSYLDAWVTEVLADGRFIPGLYAHRANAAALYFTAAQAFTRAGVNRGPPFWVAGGSGFSLSSSPQQAGLPFVNVWQGVLDVNRTWGGTTINIDENVADTASPSTAVPE